MFRAQGRRVQNPRSNNVEPHVDPTSEIVADPKQSKKCKLREAYKVYKVA